MAAGERLQRACVFPVSIHDYWYGIPEDVIKAARTLVTWAAARDLKDWTIMGIGPRPLVVINRTTEAITGSKDFPTGNPGPQQTADDNAEIHSLD